MGATEIVAGAFCTVSASKEGVVHNRSFFVILTTDSFEALFISYFKPAGIR